MPAAIHTDAIQLFALAILQGITELFPVSSLGHSVLVPALLHWDIDRDSAWFLPFIVVLHLGTATALLLYFWRDWLGLLTSVWRTRGRPVEPEARLFWLLVIGTVPAGLLGFALEHHIRTLFAGFMVAAVFLAINGVILIAGDRLKERRAVHNLETLRWSRALLIGCVQALALIPGISRSGVTLVAGLAAGLDYAASARFSFLLATPIIAAAGVLEVPKLLHPQHGITPLLLDDILISGLLAGIFAYLSTWFLMRYFSHHEVTALRPFGLYCVLAGLMAVVVYLL